VLVDVFISLEVMAFHHIGRLIRGLDVVVSTSVLVMVGSLSVLVEEALLLDMVEHSMVSVVVEGIVLAQVTAQNNLVVVLKLLMKISILVMAEIAIDGIIGEGTTHTSSGIEILITIGHTNKAMLLLGPLMLSLEM
jgi:hypothetical protein